MNVFMSYCFKRLSSISRLRPLEVFFRNAVQKTENRRIIFITSNSSFILQKLTFVPCAFSQYTTLLRKTTPAGRINLRFAKSILISVKASRTFLLYLGRDLRQCHAFELVW